VRNFTEIPPLSTEMASREYVLMENGERTAGRTTEKNEYLIHPGKVR